MLRTCFVVVCALAQAVPAQATLPQTSREAVPTPAQLTAARAAGMDAVVDLLPAWTGHDITALTLRLLDEAETRRDPVLRYLLMQQAMRLALNAGSLESAQRVATALETGFAVDRVGLRRDMLSRLARHASVPAGAIIQCCVRLADEHVEDGTQADGTHAWRALLDDALATAEARGTSAVHSWLSAQRGRLIAARAAWEEVADEPPGSPARTRYQCLYRGAWSTHGSELETPAAERILAAADSALPDALTCLNAAEHYRARAAKAATDPAEHNVAAESLLRRAAFWYRLAWLNLEGAEQSRVLKQLDALEAKLHARQVFGGVRFDKPSALDAVHVERGTWRVEDGRLVGTAPAADTAATVTYKTHFSSIDSVVIRGGIESAAGLNFRFAVGDFNMLLNWEVRPENHAWVGDHAHVTRPHALEQGVEHEIRVRQMHGLIVVFVDGKEWLRQPGRLHGTVCIYPGLGSEIFAREIEVVGTVDLGRVVTGPSGRAR